MKRGYLGEGQQWLERALAGAAEASLARRTKALIGLWHMTYFQGDYARTEILAQESLTLARELGDMGSSAFSLFAQALVAMERGNFETLAMLAAQCEAAANACADVWYQTFPLFLRAYGAMNDGDYGQARERFEGVVSVHRQTGDKWPICLAVANLAMLRILQEQYAEAKTLAAEGILLSLELADRVGIVWCFESLAAAYAAQARFGRAVRLWGASEALREGVGSPMFRTVSGWIHDPYVKVAREALDERTFRAAWSEGRAMPLKAAIRYALEDESV
jgi:ATP/maltotriose-dependent transcriptional regulator MalT